MRHKADLGLPLGYICAGGATLEPQASVFFYFVLRGRNEVGNDVLDPSQHNSVPGETHFDNESPRTPCPEEESFPGALRFPNSTHCSPESPSLCRRWHGASTSGSLPGCVSRGGQVLRENKGSPGNRRGEGHSRQGETAYAKARSQNGPGTFKTRGIQCHRSCVSQSAVRGHKNVQGRQELRRKREDRTRPRRAWNARSRI